MQALWFHDSPLYQMPHFTDKHLKFCGNRKHGVGTIQKFVDLDPDKRREVLQDLTEKQMQDVDHFCTHFPDIDVKVKSEVEDEEGLCENDVLTVAEVRSGLATGS